MFGIGVVFFGGEGLVYNNIDVGLGQTQYLAQLADDGLTLEGIVGSQQGGVFFSVTFENIIGHIISFVPGEVDVEIGWRAAIGVDESFEVEVEFERIYVGDAQVVCYDGVGPTTPPHVVVARRGGVADDVPGDEEVSTKAHFLDDL